MFHVELRQFPHVARAFNLERVELESRILRPWVSAAPIELDDERYSPERARLVIIEGPALQPGELGLGRGWANATRAGQDVTERVLSEARRGGQPTAAVAAFKDEIVKLSAGGPLELPSVVELAGERYPDARVSERLALAEQALWELLHQGRLRMHRGLDSITSDQWRPALLSWENWASRGADAVVIEAAPLT